MGITKRMDIQKRIDDIDFLDFSDEKSRTSFTTILRHNRIKLTFIKLNGDIRVMYCTLTEDVIKDKFSVGAKAKKSSDEILSVYDLENEGWRSFRWDSVIDWEISNYRKEFLPDEDT